MPESGAETASGRAPESDRGPGLPRLAGWPVAFLALRYLGAVRRVRGVSFISLVSIGGLMLGVAALITVLSVMNGFDRELRERILGVVPHVLVTPDEGVEARALAARLEGTEGVRAAAVWAEARGMITTGTRVLPIGLAGIDPEREAEFSPLPQAMVAGELASLTADGGVLLGASLGARLGLFPGDRVTFLLPRAAGDSVQPELLTLEVRGLFRLGAEPDHLVAFMHVDALTASRARVGAQVRLALDDLYRAPMISARLAGGAVPGVASTSDWTDRYGELFQAVGMEKTMMGVLLGLIVAIAVFNIVASLAMVVDEKRGAIAILRTLGADRGRIVRIFVLQGALIGGLGVAVGIGAGVLLALHIGDLMALAESAFGFRLLAGTYFDVLPSELRAADVVRIAVFAFAMAIGGALYPALRAGRVDPAPALHGH